jgi:regulator of replication initiation timing
MAARKTAAQKAQDELIEMLQSMVKELRTENERLAYENKRLRQIMGDYGIGHAIQGVFNDALRIIDRWLF